MASDEGRWCYGSPGGERGLSSRYAYRTSQDETPVKDARSPQNAGAFWLPHAPLRGAFGVLDRRFAGRCQGLSSMRRTSTLEVQMTTLNIHPHAAFDRFAVLVESVKEEFGTDGLMSNVELFSNRSKTCGTGLVREERPDAVGRAAPGRMVRPGRRGGCRDSPRRTA